ncbi:Hypothetical predicted protein [Mytilus galloprovincialis]|uniref:Uncharacterized protein n=1 Tax=Mytilus galloprovincialis TaxID=29158 RepID=A0A8B6GFJ1_MYTGA|nr:Hypothetical predicted protein [Mytilus galloprovincialis]
MGNTHSSIEEHIEGHTADLGKAPSFMHIIENGPNLSSTGTAAQRIDSAMSLVRVSIEHAKQLQSTLKQECFSKWEEECKILEFHGYEANQIETLAKNQ